MKNIPADRGIMVKFVARQSKGPAPATKNRNNRNNNDNEWARYIYVGIIQF